MEKGGGWIMLQGRAAGSWRRSPSSGSGLKKKREMRVPYASNKIKTCIQPIQGCVGRHAVCCARLRTHVGVMRSTCTGARQTCCRPLPLARVRRPAAVLAAADMYEGQGGRKKPALEYSSTNKPR